MTGGVPVVAQWKQTQLVSMRMRVRSLVLVSVSCGVGRRCGSDPMCLWLWCRLAAAAPIQPLAWELPYAAGVALKNIAPPQKKKKKEMTSSHETKTWVRT